MKYITANGLVHEPQFSSFEYKLVVIVRKQEIVHNSTKRARRRILRTFLNSGECDECLLS